MTDWECTDRGRYFAEEGKGGRALVSGTGLVVLYRRGRALIGIGRSVNGEGTTKVRTVVVVGVVEEVAWFEVSVLGALCLSAKSLSWNGE